MTLASNAGFSDNKKYPLQTICSGCFLVLGSFAALCVNHRDAGGHLFAEGDGPAVLREKCQVFTGGPLVLEPDDEAVAACEALGAAIA